MSTLLHRIPAALPCLAWLCLAAGTVQALPPGTRFTGRVLYRGTKLAAPGVAVEIVEAEDDGKPKDGEDDVLATVRADAQGRFTVVLPKTTDAPVALAASAVRVSAESGGDRRREGYEIKSRRTVLGFLAHPTPAKPNILFIERRKPGRPANGDDD